MLLSMIKGHWEPGLKPPAFWPPEPREKAPQRNAGAPQSQYTEQAVWDPLQGLGLCGSGKGLDAVVKQRQFGGLDLTYFYLGAGRTKAEQPSLAMGGKVGQNDGDVWSFLRLQG